MTGSSESTSSKTDAPKTGHSKASHSDTDAEECGPFLERVRQALGHDLHTPLGTIANYAAILEYQTETKPEDVRILAGRIRSSAMRMSGMLRQMADAIVLSEGQPAETSVDPDGLVRALATELNMRVAFPRNHKPHVPVPFDRELLAFTWRAFLAVNAEAAAAKALDLDLEVEQSPMETALILSIGPPATDAPKRVGWSKFSDGASGSVAPEACFALGFAEWLIRNRGGDLGLWGHPGQSARMRIALAPRC